MKRAEYWTLSLLALLAWGSLSFGAVYAWAYIPLLCGAAILGVAGVTDRGHGERGFPLALAIGLALVATAAAVQLIPLSATTIQRLNPSLYELIQLRNLAFGAGMTTRHPLSIDPSATVRGLAFVVTLGLLLLGSTRILTRISLKVLCAGVIALSTLLALIGIVQKPLYAGAIYGFWEPEYGGSPFGPFVNKNHFAGWMIMALALSLGFYCGRISSLAGGSRAALRDRVLWLASAEANQLLLFGICLAVMALSLVLTLSRSGISCLAAAIVITGAMTLIRRGNPSHRRFIGAYLVLLLVVAIGWAGSEAVAQRFASADWSEYNNRLGAWRDAWQIALRFMPLGSGLNTYGAATSHLQTHDLRHHYVEAHNDYLQLMAEGGLLVGVPALFTLLVLAWLVWKRFRASADDPLTWWIRAGAVTGLLAIALQEVVEFSLQMPGNALLFVVVAAIAIHEPAPAQERRRVHSRRELSVAV